MPEFKDRCFTPHPTLPHKGGGSNGPRDEG